MRTVLSGTVLAAVAGLLVSGVVAQQFDRQQQQQTRRDTQQQTERQPQLSRGQQAKSQKSIVRASELIGMNVRNNADEDLGQIEDLALDPQTGEVKYAAVSMGGFLGIGDQLFAVPWQTIECRPEKGATAQPGEEPDKVAIVNVDKETMQNAQGFDQDNWPDMANKQWQQQNDRHYRTSKRPERRQTERPGQTDPSDTPRRQ